MNTQMNTGSPLLNPDQNWMEKVLSLVQDQIGKTSPNPATAAIVVKDGHLIATGVHHGPFTPHAEAAALSNAGDHAKGATLYVNLEPCTHHGRTGPCADAIIQAGISRVVYALSDPNPLVKARNSTTLFNQNGIEVTTGVLAHKAIRQNLGFFKTMITQKPYIILKMGTSLDGKIALKSGESQYITNTKSRQHAHQMRRQHDALLIGAKTVLIDNPQLTVRFNLLTPGYRNPKIIIADPHHQLHPNLRVFHNRSIEDIIVLCQNPATYPEALPATIVNGPIFPCTHDPKKSAFSTRFDWEKISTHLADIGIQSLIIEGGSGIYSSWLASGQVDELHHYLAPKIIGKNGLDAFSDFTIETLDKAYPVTVINTQQHDGDIWIQSQLIPIESWWNPDGILV